jgi:Lrp/AsnC family transcriptional regulator for asnA, asnC and gidA
MRPLDASATRRGLGANTQLRPSEIALIGLLQQDGRKSFRSLAAELDMPERLVRQTVSHLLESGVITVTAVTFPPLLGYRGMGNVAVRVANGHSAREVARRIAELDAVDYVAITTGRFDMFVDVVCRDRPALLATVDEHIRPIPGVVSVEIFNYLALQYQTARGQNPLVAPGLYESAQIELSDIDKIIVSRLAADGRERYSAIADSLGISEAQVRQRVRRLTDGGALRIVAIANPQSLGYQIMAWVGVRIGDEDVWDVVRKISDCGSTTYVAVTTGRFDVFAELVCFTEAELLDELANLRRAAAEVEAFVYLDLFYKRLSML